MSVYVSAYVWKHSGSTGSTRLLLLALADLADDDGIIPPHRSATIEQLRKKCNFESERTVRYCLRELEGQDSKELNKEGKPQRPGLNPPELATAKGAGTRPSRYQILMRQLPMFGPGEQHQEHDLPAEAAVDNSEESGKNPVSKGQAHAPPTGNAVPPQGANGSIPRGTALPPTARIDVKARERRTSTPRPTPVDKNEKPYNPSAAVLIWATERGYTPFLHLHIEHFRNRLLEPKVRAKYTDLDAAFRNSVLADYGGVRKAAQFAARDGRGPDLERWWVTNDGFIVKAVALGVKRGESEPFTRFQIRVLDAAVDADGWGAWVDRDRQSQHFSWVCDWRKKAGKDYPGMQIEEEPADA